MKNKNIGVFDSGVGGLSIVKHLIDVLPNENIVYFGDVARVPYGSRSEKTILKYALEDINFLKTKDVKMIIAACGTVSSIFFKKGIDHTHFNGFFYTGIIEATAKQAIKTTKNKKIGIIGTKATIASMAYETYIKNLDNKIDTLSIPCPLLASIVEEGLFHTQPKIVKELINTYLKNLKNSNIDTLILGCTHYPLLSDFILNYFDRKISLINPGIEIAKFAKSYLTSHNLLNLNGGKKQFFINDDLSNFKNIATEFLNINILNNFETINLDDIETKTGGLY